jgi:hypothetical protein
MLMFRVIAPVFHVHDTINVVSALNTMEASSNYLLVISMKNLKKTWDRSITYFNKTIGIS